MLFRFVSALEDLFTSCFRNTELRHDSVVDVLDIILHKKGVGTVGCVCVGCVGCWPTAHLTDFYIVTRLHFYV